MKRLLSLLVLFLFHSGYAQLTTKEAFHSEVLEETRSISIHLPSGFHDTIPSGNLSLIVVLDADFLFYPVVGAVESLLYRDLIPETMVVGIHQNEPTENHQPQRWKDCEYNAKTGLLTPNGMHFQSFMTQELLPFLAKKYPIGPFKALIGHSFTANYVNYFLLDKTSPFSGYVALSPYIPTVLEPALSESIEHLTSPNYYFLSTADQDLSGHLQQIERQDTSLFACATNPKWNYAFEKYPGETHLSLAWNSCLPAIRHLFSGYLPLYDLPEKIPYPEQDCCTFIRTRYEQMHAVYGGELNIREADLLELAWKAEELQRWDDVEQLGDLTVQYYPESVYGYYMKASFCEQQQYYDEALRLYQKGYQLLGEEVLNKEDFYADIERIEQLIKRDDYDGN
jgi:uncharacterized protein